MIYGGDVKDKGQGSRSRWGSFFDCDTDLNSVEGEEETIGYEEPQAAAWCSESFSQTT